MRSIELKKIYHPKMGRFVYKHKGSGIIFDNLMKPIKNVASAAFKNFVKPFSKKALSAGVSHAAERLGRAVSQKSGDYIMKQLHGNKKAVSQNSGDYVMKKLHGNKKTTPI